MKETVLVIDDEEGIRQVLGAALETDGYEAILEETGDSAEKRVRDGSVDCVILDLVLPDKDGLEILETILTED
ncbi:MAG: response regulator, partial [Acidobacteriota bacterium]